ncbi:helix-turn-helix domain-containing protein [Streptomyces griseorubiginosus]|uniref:helix-turn-helix domain-containing protein n=1 Tax=Streptomyces griseorubiginosus TaxID=67304 RepID=UPI0036EB6398
MQRCGYQSTTTATTLWAVVGVSVLWPYCALAEGRNVVDAVGHQRKATGRVGSVATTEGPNPWAELGEWIAIRRRELGMDQKELAAAADVSENTVGNYERGRVPARGKMSPGYLRVEKALQFAPGSFENILTGGNPFFAVEGEHDRVLQLRDPEEVSDPKAKILIPVIAEALQYKKFAMSFADLAYRWNASEAALERYKAAVDNLLMDMISPGHGPAEVVRFLRELEQQGEEIVDPRRPDLGWTVLVVDPETDRNTVGARISDARVSKGLTVDALSEESRVPVRVIRLIEADDFNFPGAFMHAPVYIELLAKSLDISPDPLIRLFNEAHGPKDRLAEAEEKLKEAGGVDRAFPENAE